MDTVRQDLRLAARRLLRSPGFSLAAILALALGVGLNCALFGLVDQILLRPLPYPHADRLVMITRSGDVSIPDGIDWRAEVPVLDSVALFLRTWEFDLAGDGPPERLTGSVAEPELFDVFGVRPALGRLYGKDDDRLGGDRIAVISHRLWRSRFGADPGAVGSTITLSDHRVTIVGILPRGFDPFGDDIDVWVPPAVETPWAVHERGTNNFDAVGRLAPGATLEQARSQLRVVCERLAAEYPRTNKNKIVIPIPLRDFLVGPVQRGLATLFGAVVLVLLLASVNLAGLQLVRSVAREDEFAVRAAIGAGRGRILRQLVTEGLLLSLLGGAAGLVVAAWAQDALLALAPETLPRAAEVGIDPRVFGFAFAAAVLAGLVSSLLPALNVMRSDPGAFLTGARSTAGRQRQRLLAGLVGAEVALACVLLVGSGLLLRTFRGLSSRPLGFQPERLLTASLVLPESRYSQLDAQTRAFTEIVDRLNRTSGVESAAYVIGLPLANFGLIGHRVLFQGHPVEPGQEPGARSRPVVGDYFGTLRLRIVAGRAFTPDDRSDSPRVAVVNESFARAHFGGASPLGKRIAWGLGDQAPAWMQIVGVAADVRSTSLAHGDVEAVYTPYVQRTEPWQRFGSLVVRTRTEPSALVPALREAVWSVDPTLPVADVHTMTEYRSDATARERFNAIVLAAFAGMALIIAVQGLYALLAWAVAQSRREIGVRLALGARPVDVARLVARRGLRLGLAGLVGGMAGAIALSRWISGLLYGVTATDPGTYAAVAGIVGLTAVLASTVPARRAAHVDPGQALREP